MSEKVAPADPNWVQPPPYPVQPPPQQPQQAQPPPQYNPTQPATYQQPMRPGQTSTTVVLSQPVGMVVGVNQPARSNQPVRLTCPACQQNILTTIEHEIGTFSWLMVGAVFLFGFAFPLVWLGCCFIPLCIRDAKDVKHTCPNCKTHLGTYQRAR